MSYPELPGRLQEVEEETLARWREEDLFSKTMEANAEGEPFVFFEGPPTANGRPGLHHIISRTIKDLVCRHRSMEGRSVTRIAGWDTHGLPVEIEAEKRLGISGKPEIEAVGIARFNEVCRDSVFTYKEEWENLSERIAYWLDYSRPYVTFHPEYVESVWWILKELADKGLLYRGHKSVPYCPRCGTALSSHEVAQGYRDVEDPSLTFRARIVEEDAGGEARSFLVWTTTPWTVPSNVGLAVHPGLRYVEVLHEGERVIVAEARAEAIFGEDAEIVGRYSGAELAGTRYERPLDLVTAPEDPQNAWTVVAEDFVSADDGTGIVHMAPAFGADDYEAGRRHGLPMLNPLDEAGCFHPGIPVVGGMFAKDADPVLVEELRERGGLFHIASAVHSYPHCWRCDSPLLYVARHSWFAATSTVKDRMLANNAQVNWCPPEVGEKRFGEWLRGNVDWALSRDRYWGTPLPVWVCDEDEDHVTWVGSLAELGEKAGGLPDGFDPHRPFIDEVTWGCERCAGTMRRSPAVIDVWFDSGSMPYAQWHYPFENREEFDAHFPADFICEGLDQTRGWFYSLMAISTMLGRGPSFRNVVVNDLILDAEGQKMSKSRGNTVDPWDAIADHGADGLRWYLITSSNPWVPKRYDPAGVKEAARKFFDTLFNTYRFFALYAGTDGWTPSDADPRPGDRALIDRWLLSRLETLAGDVTREMDAYQLTRAYRALGEFVVEDLSNWYVRRSRPRFWGNADDADARSAFRTLWEALRTVAVLAAPVVPFTADWIHRALTGESVHLQRYPEPSGASDPALEEDMVAVRTLVSLGRAAREEVRIRVRQPLGRMVAVVPGGRALEDDVL
ncbi:MAG: isoleucine--tRNA ligase, partial [Gemmatimonadota bacterium]|nr:isoleucine--tRNA ligase [Gemmatimonadota bacterium]